MKKDIEKIICNKCGFDNVEGTKTCVKCGERIKAITKSCPRCAKRNKYEAEKCTSCGYKFNRKRRTILFDIILVLLLVGFLCFLVYLDKTDLVSNINKGFKLLAGVFVVIILYTTLFYGKKEKINYNVEEGIIEDNKRFSKLKKISNIAVIIGILVAFGIIIYFTIFNKA